MAPDRDHVISGLSALLGSSHVIADDAMMAPYLTDWRKRYSGRALCVVRPAKVIVPLLAKVIPVPLVQLP